MKPVLLAANPDSAQLERECAWLSEQITTWLDEEWQPQAEHVDLGVAAGLVGLCDLNPIMKSRTLLRESSFIAIVGTDRLVGLRMPSN